MLPTYRRQIAIWLFVCSAMVFTTLIVGGVTRLTHSGLSIVEWQPIVGALPPLNQSEWDATFDKYKLTPEYQQVNHQMSLDEFKVIFFWEYWHRNLGRLIGVAFFFPFCYFALRRALDWPLARKLIGIFVLGGMQGAMGWYMVKSGLVDDPHVSQFRLTAHLSLAFLIFVAQMWVALDLLNPRSTGGFSSSVRALQKFALALVYLLAYMIVSGGFVAGIRAGKAYNTFPLMNGSFVPPEIFDMEPWYLNFFYNMATVQFDHRLGAWIFAFVVPWLWLKLRAKAVAGEISSQARLASNVMLVAVAGQITLGILTVLNAVPVGLGASHQAGSMVVMATLLWLNHALRVKVQTTACGQHQLADSFASK